MEMSGLPASNDSRAHATVPCTLHAGQQVELEPSACHQCGDVIIVDTCSLYLESGICFCSLKP
jgi:hypothetical protein